MIGAFFRPHLHKSKMAAIWPQGTIGKEVIIAWPRVIHAFYIFWGWQVHLWCVFYNLNAPSIAKSKMATNYCPWTVASDTNLIWTYAIHEFYIFSRSRVNFWCVFCILNMPWVLKCQIQDGCHLPVVNPRSNSHTSQKVIVIWACVIIHHTRHGRFPICFSTSWT